MSTRVTKFLAFVKHWVIPDVGGWVPYAVCFAALYALLYVINPPGIWSWVLGLMGWWTAMGWYAYWKRSR